MARSKTALSNRPLLPSADDAALFIDRAGLVGRIERALAQDLNVLLVGDWGSGRTSLLRHLVWLNNSAEDPLHMVYVDGARTESAIGVIEELRAELDRPRHIGMAAGVALRGLGNFRVAPSASSVALEYLRDLREDDPATILLDGLPSAEVGHTLFGALRDELWQLPYTWVLAAHVRDKAALLTPPADAFWDVELRLDPFTPDEARKLLRARLDDETLVDELVHLGDGNPRNQIALARDVVLEGRSPGELQQRHVEEELRLQAVGRAAYMLMHEVRSLGRPVSASDDELLRRMGWTRQRAARVLQQLESAGFLESYAGLTEGQGRPPRLFRVPGTVDE